MPIGNTGPTNTGSHSSLISDGHAPFKPRKSIKTSLSPQPNTDPATMESQSPTNRSSSYPARATWPAAAVCSETATTTTASSGTASFPRNVSPTPPSTASTRVSGGCQGVSRCTPTSTPRRFAFANRVRECAGEVGLVPCAVGGTAIKEWARGEHLYENMIKRARASVEGGGEIKGLLWYQGESDTSTQHDADAYLGEHDVENVREVLVCLRFQLSREFI